MIRKIKLARLFLIIALCGLLLVFFNYELVLPFNLYDKWEVNFPSENYNALANFIANITAPLLSVIAIYLLYETLTINQSAFTDQITILNKQFNLQHDQLNQNMIIDQIKSLESQIMECIFYYGANFNKHQGLDSFKVFISELQWQVIYDKKNQFEPTDDNNVRLMKLHGYFFNHTRQPNIRNFYFVFGTLELIITYIYSLNDEELKRTNANFLKTKMNYDVILLSHYYYHFRQNNYEERYTSVIDKAKELSIFDEFTEPHRIVEL